MHTRHHHFTKKQVATFLLWTSFVLFTLDLIIAVLLKDVVPPPVYLHLETISAPLSRWAGFTGALLTVAERSFAL